MIKNSPYFLVNFFLISAYFHYFTFDLSSNFLLQISSSITYTYFFPVHVKPIKIQKKSAARNIDQI